MQTVAQNMEIVGGSARRPLSQLRLKTVALSESWWTAMKFWSGVRNRNHVESDHVLERFLKL